MRTKTWIATVTAVNDPAYPSYTGWKPCIEWCRNHLYHGGHYEPLWHYLGEGVFEFEDEQEYITFLLRWA